MDIANLLKSARTNEYVDQLGIVCRDFERFNILSSIFHSQSFIIQYAIRAYHLPNLQPPERCCSVMDNHAV